MEKKKRNILIWSLTWAVLLLAVLYSPLGSPDLYSPKSYTSVQPDVSINAIDNSISPTFKNSNKSRTNSYNQATNTSDLGSEINNSNLNNNRTTTYRNLDVNSSVGFATSNYSQSSNINATGSGMSTGFISLSERSSRNNSTNSPNTGVISGNLGLLAENNLTTTKLQGSSSKTGDGNGTDPGGDPDDPPIPVGDGFLFLFFLSILFTVWKMKTTKN